MTHSIPLQTPTRLPLLNEWIARSCPGTSADDFIQHVGLAYQQAQRALRLDKVANPRECSSFADFQHALANLPVAESVLVVGCGPGIPGPSSSLAAHELAALFPHCRIRRLDLSTSTSFHSQLCVPGPFDAVVTYSIAHHLHNLGEFFDFAGAQVSVGGWLVIGHEPNASFWRNEECIHAMRDLRSIKLHRKRWARYLSPSRYLAWTRALLFPQWTEPSMTECVNEFLRVQFGHSSPLSELDIVRIVDLHRPQEAAECECLGCRGLDPARYLPGFQEIGRATSCHVGYTPRGRLNAQWSSRDSELARRFPNDGATMSVCLERKAR